MDDAIRSTRNFTPRKDVVSDWRKKMYERINVIATINEMKVQDVFRDVYEYMNRVYTFVIEEERKKYCAKTGRTGHIPTIDVVEASTMYKSIFGALVEDLYTEAVSKKKEEATERKALPEAKTIEAAPEVAVCDTPVIEVEVNEVESEPVAEEKPKKQSETAKTLIPILLPLAEKLWVLVGEDLTAGLPVLSTYLGHNDLSGTQRYLQLTAQMYPDITQKLEKQFGELIPTMEVPR